MKKLLIIFIVLFSDLTNSPAYPQDKLININYIEFISGDPDMDVKISTSRNKDHHLLNIIASNNDENRILRNLKIKINRTILKGFDVIGYYPEPKYEIDWSPLNFTIKYGDLVQLTPGESVILEIYLIPIRTGTYKGEISIHALKGYFKRFTPQVYAITIESTNN